MIHSDPPRVKDSETNSELGQLLRFIFRKNLDVEGHWKKHLMGGGERLSHEAPSYPLGDAITTPRRIDGMRGGRRGIQMRGTKMRDTKNAGHLPS